MKVIFYAFAVSLFFLSCNNNASGEAENQVVIEEYNSEKETIEMILKNATKIYASAQEEKDIINQDTMILYDIEAKLSLYLHFSAKIQTILRIFIENDLENTAELISKAEAFKDEDTDKLILEFQKAVALYMEVEEIFQLHK